MYRHYFLIVTSGRRFVCPFVVSFGRFDNGKRQLLQVGCDCSRFAAHTLLTIRGYYCVVAHTYDTTIETHVSENAQTGSGAAAEGRQIVR